MHPFELNQTSSNFDLDSQVFIEPMVAATNSYFYEILVAWDLQKNHDLTSVFRLSKTTIGDGRLC